MRLNKIFIKNFKGIESSKVIHFQENGLTLLDGPNGFGKTTIFEVLELCLRGEIHKTDARKGVTEDYADYYKPFYQNRVDDDVLLKAHFEKDDGESLVIIKFLPQNTERASDGGRAFKPTDWDLLKTFKGSSETFDSEEIDTNDLEELEQEQINDFFFERQEVQINKTYLLFNYLQQEENIFFLKKSENEKRKQLDFLFQTVDESNKLDQIGSYLRELRKIKNELEKKINNLKKSDQDITDVEYERLFKDRDIKFDEKNPFEEIGLEELKSVYESFLNRIENLKELLTHFDTDEYLKLKRKNKIESYSHDESLLYAFMLQDFLSEDRLEELNTLVNKRAKFEKFLESENKESEIQDILKEFDYDSEGVAVYKKLKDDLISLNKEADSLTKLISELNELRERIFNKYQLLRKEQQTDNSDCPLCGTPFESLSSLEKSIEEKKELFKAHHENKINKIEKVKEQIYESYVDPVLDQIEDFLNDSENYLDKDFFKKVKELKSYTDYIGNLEAILTKFDLDISKYKLSKKISGKDLKANFENFREDLTTLFEGIEIDPQKVKNRDLFKVYFDEDEESFKTIDIDQVDKKEKYIINQYYNKKISFLEKLEEREEKIDKLVTAYSDIQNTYEEEIRAYKKRMIDKIRVPFYLYSGKILRHYQQGMGIFIHMKPTTNRIRFLTESESDHDVVHHLSSGQLAVVSLAFCLALNKVYSISKGFRFLAIDDPVQTMDDINIHALIELIRHDFSDYQIILSTHEDDISSYMNYKFKKFDFDVKRLNVQNAFYA